MITLTRAKYELTELLDEGSRMAALSQWDELSGYDILTKINTEVVAGEKYVSVEIKNDLIALFPKYFTHLFNQDKLGRLGQVDSLVEEDLHTRIKI